MGMGATTMMGPHLGSIVAALVSQVREEERHVTELRYLPEGWFAIATVAIVVGLLWLVAYMYRNEGRVGASPRMRAVMATLRCLILLLLAVIVFEPVSVRILRRWIDSYTVVLVDDSSSMDLADQYRDSDTQARVANVMNGSGISSPRRTDVASRILEADDRAFLRKLADNNRVKLYSFGDEVTLAASIRATREGDSGGTAMEPATDSLTDESKDSGEGAASVQVPDVASAKIALDVSGAVTNVERAMRRSVESLGNAPVAGVVVLSDGGFNQGANVDEVARFARERGISIQTVGLGDPSPPRNVRIAEISAPENAVQDDPFVVSVSLAVDGAVTEPLTVKLYERNATDGGVDRLVDTRDVRAVAGGQIAPLTFERSQNRDGRYVYTARVDAIAGESVTEDNSKQTAVQVIDAQTRVLIVAGSPSWDYRYLSRLLQRDDTFNVSCWLQSADLSAVRDGDTVIDHLPTTAEELFEYDVVLLLDPSPEDIDENWCRLIDTLVTEYGGGVLFAAARAHTPTLMRERTYRPLLDLLPVTMDPEADLVLNQIGHYQTEPSPIEIPQESFGHPIMRLADDPVSTKLAWSGIGEVYWHYPVLREKPVATVLMRHANPRMRNGFGGHVLAAVQYVGAGRSAFIGFDTSWRWRRWGEEIYDRFWIQMLRYLSEGKLLGGSKRATVLVENENPSIGEAITVNARLLNARYEPILRDQIDARVEIDGDRRSFPLTPQSDRPGWFEGRFVPDRVGTFRITVQLPTTAAEEPVIAERDIIVSRPNLEIVNPRMNKAALVSLAENSGGGRFWEVDQTSALADEIPDLHEEIPIRSRPRSLWDNGMVLAVLVVLMSLEWALRKWNRLL